MEVPKKELAFAIQVIGTTIHQVSQTRKQGGILIPELPGMSPLRSVFLHGRIYQDLCACPSFA